jgi:dTDP-4-amino-4,6-dideoxygalactose transaminase
MKINLFDLNINQQTNKKIKSKIFKLMEDKDFILGDEVLKFEKNMSDFLDTSYAVGVNSGTDALELSLKAVGVKSGDNVIVPGFSFFATSEVVYKLNAEPLYCDINIDDLTIDRNSFDDLLDHKIKSVIPVHLFGNSSDLEHIKKRSTELNFTIIEDVAQAFGSKYKNRMLGSIGDTGCFSFYPTKNIGAFGDGGLVTTKSKRVYKNLLALRNHGITNEKYVHNFVGYNSRLDTIQAIVLNEKLKIIKKQLSKRVEINNWYLKELASIPYIKVHSQPNQPMNLLPISFESKKYKEKVVQKLNKNNVSTGKYYPLGLHKQPFIKKQKKLKNVEWATENIVTLPSHPNLKKYELEYIHKLLKV